MVACSCSKKINQTSGGFFNTADLARRDAGPQNHFETCPCAANPYVSCSDYLDFLSKYYQAGRTSSGTHINAKPLSPQT